MLSDAPVNAAFTLLTTHGRRRTTWSASNANVAVARGREPVLVRPLRRALRALGPAAARRADQRASTRPPARADGSAPALVLARRLGLIDGRRRSDRAAAPCRDPSGAGAGRAPAPALARRIQPARPDVGRQLARAEPADRRPGVPAAMPSLPLTLAWLDRAVTSMMTLSGFVLDGMTRGIGWRFLSIGRRVERLSTLCAALQVAIDEGRTARPRLAARVRRLDGHLPLALPGRRPNGCRCSTCCCATRPIRARSAFQVKGLVEYIAKLERRHGRFAERRCSRRRSAALRALVRATSTPDSAARRRRPRSVAARGACASPTSCR